jgi:DNA-binding NarL/FixJ family response regulator
MTDQRSWALVVDDHPMCREAARMALEAVDPTLRVEVAGTLAEAIDNLRTSGLSIICLDLHLPDSNGFAALLTLQRMDGSVPIIVVSSHDQRQVSRRAFDLGASGFLSKAESITTMIEAFRTVLAGERCFPADFATALPELPIDVYGRLRELTGAQRRVLNAMADGRQNKQIAHDLNLSEITVKSHVKEILRKLKVVNRTQAILLDRTLAVDRVHLSFNPKE